MILLVNTWISLEENELTKKSEATKILDVLESLYPDPETALEFKSPFQLLVATILSAQTTDKQVNKITSNLFSKHPTARNIARLTPAQLEEIIKSCGLYRNKSKNIIETSKIISRHYNGEVPDNLEELVKLPGVGRKTANVVLANAFEKPAFPVDTHVKRVSSRLGLSRGKNVSATEEELCEIIPRELWNKAHHWLIYHGRNVCKAKSPLCSSCSLYSLCENKIKKK